MQFITHIVSYDISDKNIYIFILGTIWLYNQTLLVRYGNEALKDSLLQVQSISDNTIDSY